MQYICGELQNKIKRKEPKQKATKRNDTEENLTTKIKNKKLKIDENNANSTNERGMEI